MMNFRDLVEKAPDAGLLREMTGSAIPSRFAGHARRGAQTGHARRLKPDHPVGAGHVAISSQARRS
jgi:hypothetical protein